MKNLTNLNAVQTAIKELGEVQRDLAITKAELDEQISNLQNAYSKLIDDLSKKEDDLTQQITAFCNKNFQLIFKDGSKTAKLITGEISRRKKPNSLLVENLELALAQLKEKKLECFIKVKEDLNKSALLNSPETIAEIEGIEIQTGLESLIIKPYSTQN